MIRNRRHALRQTQWTFRGFLGTALTPLQTLDLRKDGPRRQALSAFVTLQGHRITNFDKPVHQGLLLRGVAWAGKRPVESLLRTTATDRSIKLHSVCSFLPDILPLL
jgi:hypothetical protein